MKRIYKYDFNQLLMYIPEISPKEREYLVQFFANDLVDGLTEFELRKKIEKLKFDQKDQIDTWEAEKVKQKVLDALGKK